MSSLLEIVELDGGEIILRNSEGDKSPLMNIRFGEQSDRITAADRLEVAKAMIQAGMAAFAEIIEVQEQETALLSVEERFEQLDSETSYDLVLH